MTDEVSDLTPMLDHEDEIIVLVPSRSSRNKKISNGITMSVLFLINLLNFMDRYAIAGILQRLQDFYNINDATSGLLQTVFICSFMALAPLFGYLGDRYSRKLLIIFGVTLWSITTLASSFVPANMFWLFLTSRCIVGVGEASYACVAPTIIADMYKKDMRTAMLALFNIAVPLGSGLGYVVGSSLANAYGYWQPALRLTPALGIACVLTLIIFVKEPKRGANEGAAMVKKSSWFSDIKYVMKIKSFILIAVGFTGIAFSIGSISFWGPIFLEKGHILAYNDDGESVKKQVPLYFGIITCAAGIIGVLIASEVARRYRRINPRADPIVCGLAVISGVPFLYFTIIFSSTKLTTTWILVFFAETLLLSNWALISDMLLYIVVPERRSTASAILMFFMHLLGDASSPYIIGAISDDFKHGATDNETEWISLRNALMITPFIATIGGAAFLFATFYIIQDRRRAEADVQSVDDDLQT